MKKLSYREKYRFNHLKRRPEFASHPLFAHAPQWMTSRDKPSLLEAPDLQALSDQARLFMGRCDGQWGVGANNAEGLRLSASRDKAPAFLSSEAALDFLGRHARMDDFELGVNARSEGREIRLSMESKAGEPKAALGLKKRSL